MTKGKPVNGKEVFCCFAEPDATQQFASRLEAIATRVEAIAVMMNAMNAAPE